MTDGWMADARRAPLALVASELGLEVTRGRFRPCPACGARNVSRSQRRPPIGHRPGPGQGWQCHRCKVSGDGINLVALVLLGDRAPRDGDWSRLREWFEVRGWAPSLHPLRPHRPRYPGLPLSMQPAPPPPPPKRHPAVEVEGVWRRALTVVDHPDARRWLEARRLPVARVAALDLARALPTGLPLPTWARFRSQGWPAAGYPLLLPCYDHTGALRALRARWTGAEQDPDTGALRKTDPPHRWPKELAPSGAAVRGLAVAPNPLARWLLRTGPTAQAGAVVAELEGRGSIAWDGRLFLVEGGPDLLRLATHPGRLRRDPEHPGRLLTFAAAAYVSGSWDDTLAARVPAHTAVRLVPDLDPNGHGEALAEKAAATFGHLRTPPAVINLDRVKRAP